MGTRGTVSRCLALLALAATICAGCGGTRQRPRTGDPTLARCASSSSARERSCFTKTARQLLDLHGPGFASQMSALLARQLDLSDPQQQRLLADCHVNMHFVGAAYVREHHLGPSALSSTLPATDDINCGAGFVHGAMGEMLSRSSIESVRVQVVRYCRTRSDRLRQLMCVHGIGHTMLAISDGDVRRAVANCARLGTWVQADCDGGVFHDYYLSASGRSPQPVPVHDVAPGVVCAGMDQVAVRACWMRAVQFEGDAQQGDPATRLRAQCYPLAEAAREGCIAGWSFLAGGQLVADCLTMRVADLRPCLLGSGGTMRVPDPRVCDAPGGNRRECARWMGRMYGLFDTTGIAGTTWCKQALPAGLHAACIAGLSDALGPQGFL